MNGTRNIIAVICLLTLGAFAGSAQTLTSTFQFTASGLIGTLATATTPFQGQTFTNAAITITAISNVINRISCQSSCNFAIPNDSATVSISGIGTFLFIGASNLQNIPTVDPVRGVTSDAIALYTSGGSALSASIPTSTAWDMLTALGPFQTTTFVNTYSTHNTNGGVLKFTSSLGSNDTFQSIFSGTPPPPTLTRSGILSHIAAGGDWNTSMTIVNPSSSAVPVTVAFRNDDGSALSIPVTTTNQGATQSFTAASVSATIGPNATLLISTGQLASTVVGWADVSSTGSLGGYAIFRQTPQSGSASEGTVPLQTQLPSTITLPYDNTAGFVMGVALANLSTTLASTTATIWDDSGNQLGTQFITIPGNGHTAFVLPNEFPLIAGKRGIVKFQNTGGIAGIGLRFSPFGTFTSVPTM